MVKKDKEIKEKPKDRKSIIRDILLSVMKDKRLFKGGKFEEERSFDMRRVVDLPGTRGMLRDVLPDFKQEDKKTFREILQDLKREGFLFHKTGSLWSWVRTT